MLAPSTAVDTTRVSKIRLLLKSLFGGLGFFFVGLYAYFFKKRRDLIARILDFTTKEGKAGVDEDTAHLRSRFASREKCNVLSLSVVTTAGAVAPGKSSCGACGETPNFRDLAANDSADLLAERTRLRSSSGGRRLIRGVIFRGANICSSSVSDAWVQQLQMKVPRLKKVIDLRNVNERKEDGNSLPAARRRLGEKNFMSVPLIPLQLLVTLSSVWIQIRMALLLVMTGLINLTSNGASNPTTWGSRHVARLGQQIIVQNCNLLGLRGIYLLTVEYNKKTILKILKAITGASEPLLIQCGSGKDATGLISMLILVALDVSEEDILSNYQMSCSLLSKEYCTAKIRGLYSSGAAGLDPAFVQASPPGAAETVLKFLRMNYGSLEAYLDDIGFDASWREKLREKMLEKK